MSETINREKQNDRPYVGFGAYYSATISAFRDVQNREVLDSLAHNSGYSVEPEQRDAWTSEIEVLREALRGVDGSMFLEFVVPRIGSRIDAVVIVGSVIFVIEFKVGESEFKSADRDQVWDYALDLKNFHEESHHATIIPILVATRASQTDDSLAPLSADKVARPLRSSSSGLKAVIELASNAIQGPEIDPVKWANSQYRPTPTIIQAARALFGRHSVESISRSDSGARNLRITSRRVEEIVDAARASRKKAIIFVTGVPGAGKTLVGLNIATRRFESSHETHAVFLSGNGPLVKVLQAALSLDELARVRRQDPKARKGDVQQKVKSFIQNVHHFRDAGLKDSGPPSDHVVIFDEAQRAWTQRMTANFMQRRRGVHGFSQSEPEVLLSYMDRKPDWAAVICLVGGGQEINQGEAGISAWLDAVCKNFPKWEVHVSPELTDDEYASGHALQMLEGRNGVFQDNGLHLAVSMRSFRAETVSNFVKAVLDCEITQARAAFIEMSKRYPIVLTRCLARAKRWVREKARGTERYGLVATSGALRLRPHAIDVRVEADPVHWFLDGPEDVRSSYYMEDIATEFQVQGLELDWTCVSWDADLRFSGADWSYHAFVGSKWTNIGSADRTRYLKNAYRVLLTRARQGMVIFVPSGTEADPTRPPAYYNATYNYLKDIGLPELAG
jgi:hypothetical protein